MGRNRLPTLVIRRGSYESKANRRCNGRTPTGHARGVACPTGRRRTQLYARRRGSAGLRLLADRGLGLFQSVHSGLAVLSEADAPGDGLPWTAMNQPVAAGRPTLRPYLQSEADQIRGTSDVRYRGRMSTATFTALLRDPSSVAAQTERGAVRITRRDADDLILIRADDADRLRTGMALTAQVLRAVVNQKGDVGAALLEPPWTAELTDDERKKFVAELEPLLWSAAELGVFDHFLDAFESWRATALAYASGVPRDTDDLTWLPDLPVVPRPA